jgi:hypothetical protein
LLTRTTEIARDLEIVVNRLASHRSARLEPRIDETLQNIGSHVGDNTSAGSAPLGENRINGRMVNGFPGRPTNSTRTWRFGQITAGTSLQPSAAAASTPSVPTVSITSNLRSRGLPLEERDRTLSSTGAAMAEQDGDADNRSYLVRRRLTADGDEQVHNISLSASDSDDGDNPGIPPVTFNPEYLNRRAVASRISQTVSRNMPPSSSPMRSLGSPNGIRPSRVHPAINDEAMPEVPNRRRGWCKPYCQFH